jgi:phage terminase small subunit
MTRVAKNPAMMQVPADYKLGRAMLALNDRQRAFVVALLETGGANYTKAAMMAGYGTPSSSSASMNVIASRLAHDDRIQAAMLEEAQKRLGANTILCTSTLVNIINGELPGCTVKDRTKAIEILLNRTGLHALSEHKVKVEHSTVDDEEALRKIAFLAKRVGIDPSKLLGMGVATPAVIEGEFVEVSDNQLTDEFDYEP